MKIKTFLATIAFICTILTFHSCDDEIERTSTHTDASSLVGGEYIGTMLLDSTAVYSDITIVLTKLEADSVQAVTFHIQSANFTYEGATGMDLTTTINVAKSSDGYAFSSGLAATLRLAGRLTGNDLVLTLPIQVRSSNKEVRFHTNGDDWVFIGTKN